jgi:hypothetical protein
MLGKVENFVNNPRCSFDMLPYTEMELDVWMPTVKKEMKIHCLHNFKFLPINTYSFSQH